MFEKFLSLARVWARKLITKPEEKEQFAFVTWLYENGYTFSSVPNSTYTKSNMQKMRNTLLWLRPWIPDLMIILKRWSLLFIEMKKPRWPKGWMNGSKISDDQRFWLNNLKKINNIDARVAHWFEEAKRIVRECEEL